MNGAAAEEIPNACKNSLWNEYVFRILRLFVSHTHTQFEKQFKAKIFMNEIRKDFQPFVILCRLIFRYLKRARRKKGRKKTILPFFVRIIRLGGVPHTAVYHT